MYKAVYLSVICFQLQCILFSFCAIAQDDPARLLARQRQEGIDLDDAWRPVLVDWPVTHDKHKLKFVPYEKEFHVLHLDSFAEAREVVQEIAGELGEIKLIHGTPCFVPINTYKSNLLLPISIKLSQVSTWDAIKAVIREVNCHRQHGEQTGVYLHTLGATNIPEAFDKERDISIEVTNLPAREVLCMIMAQAPLSIGIKSEYLYRDSEVSKWSVMIRFYRGNQPIVAEEFHSRERGSFWSKEVREAQEPAESCKDVKTE